MARREAQLANGLKMSWLEEGRGEVLLLVHGFPLSSETWQPQVEYFGKSGWRAIAPDLRGYGLTKFNAPENHVNTMDLLADDLAVLLDHLQIKKAVLMGLSMGGYISFAFWRRYPQRVRALVLADTKPEPDAPEARENRYKLRQQVLEQGSSVAADGMVPKLFSPASYAKMPDIIGKVSGVIENTSPQTIAVTLPGLAERPDSTPTLATITVPVLVVHGKDDQMMPIEGAKAYAQKIPNWQFSSVPQAGHLPNLENLDYYNRAVETFLKELK